MEYTCIEDIRGSADPHIKGEKKKSWLETHYKRVESGLKRRKPENYIYFELLPKPTSIDQVVYRLVFREEKTLCKGKLHCSVGKYRSAQDLFHLIRYYTRISRSIKIKEWKKCTRLFTYKGCSELLQYLVQENLLKFQYCNTVEKEVYIPKRLMIKLEEVKEYVEKYLEK